MAAKKPNTGHERKGAHAEAGIATLARLQAEAVEEYRSHSTLADTGSGGAISQDTGQSSLDSISFIKLIGKGRGYNYWADVSAGSGYGDDCATGERLAGEFIAFIAANPTNGNSSLLGSIMIDMSANGATKGHKIGFMNTINKYAMAGGYLAQMAAPADEEPWRKAKRLAKELSETMALCDHGEWEAYIWPDVDRLRYGFMKSPAEDTMPVDRVHRLAMEMSYAMDDWRAHTGTKFIAHVHPASTGRGVWFMNASLEGRRPNRGCGNR